MKKRGVFVAVAGQNISRSPGEKVKPTVQITEKYYSNIWIESRTRDEGVEGAGRDIFYPTLTAVINKCHTKYYVLPLLGGYISVKKRVTGSIKIFTR